MECIKAVKTERDNALMLLVKRHCELIEEAGHDGDRLRATLRAEVHADTGDVDKDFISDYDREMQARMSSC